jgi:regulator of protease activity HflC (stomatin/prohibitin superfamily)
MIAKVIGARNEIEDVLSVSSRDGAHLSSAERDRLSSILSLIESLLQDLEEAPPNTSASAMIIPFPILVTIIVVLYILSAIKILREYERGVIFRLGRLLPYAKGPGIVR